MPKNNEPLDDVEETIKEIEEAQAAEDRGMKRGMITVLLLTALMLVGGYFYLVNVTAVR